MSVSPDFRNWAARVADQAANERDCQPITDTQVPAPAKARTSPKKIAGFDGR
jgi:hypothetical protein